MAVKRRGDPAEGGNNSGASFQDTFFSLLEEITGEKRRITVSHPALTEFCGDSQDALFLSHLIYWCDKGKRTDGYIFRSKRQWQIETGLRRRTLDRIVRKYQKNGVLKVRVKLADGSPTLHYKLDREALIDNISTFVQMKPENKSTNVPMSNEAIVDDQTPDGIGTDVQMEKYKCTNGKVQNAFSRKVQNAFSITRSTHRIQQETTSKEKAPPGAPSPTGDLAANGNSSDHDNSQKIPSKVTTTPTATTTANGYKGEPMEEWCRICEDTPAQRRACTFFYPDPCPYQTDESCGS